MEIGSFIELQFRKGLEWYKGDNDVARLNTGRSAIWHAFRVSGCKAIWIPYYQCDSIRDTFHTHNGEVKYYRIDKQWNPIDLQPADNEAVLLVNYYGVMSHERMVALEHLGTLGEDFFAFPLGKEIPTVTSRFASVSSSRVRLGLLLARDLQHLGKICKHLPADSLQQAEKEALVLYAHTWLHADCCFSDAAIEANYLDFQHMRKEIRREHHISGHHSIIETNLMREAYGRTYWYYYYYGQRR